MRHVLLALIVCCSLARPAEALSFRGRSISEACMVVWRGVQAVRDRWMREPVLAEYWQEERQRLDRTFPPLLTRSGWIRGETRNYIGMTEVIRAEKPGLLSARSDRGITFTYATRHVLPLLSFEEEARALVWIDLDAGVVADAGFKPYAARADFATAEEFVGSVRARLLELERNLADLWSVSLQPEVVNFDGEFAHVASGPYLDSSLQSAHLQRIEINYTRPRPFHVPGSIEAGPDGLVLISAGERGFARRLSDLHRDILVVMRCFHPAGYVFEIAYLNGQPVLKHRHMI